MLKKGAGEVLPFCLGSNSNDQADIIVVLCCVCAVSVLLQRVKNRPRVRKRPFSLKEKGRDVLLYSSFLADVNEMI